MAAIFVAAPGTALGATRCDSPAGKWDSRTPGALRLDAKRLQSALDWASMRATFSVAVYRHGCLAGRSRLDAVTDQMALDGWSMTKSVTSMLMGRAATLGMLDLDAPIKRLFPEADPAHGAITPRRLVTMTSGLHRNWVRELSPQLNRVDDALHLPFDHAPGTYWEYAQSPMTLLGEAVSRAAGKDLQDFAQAELFGPLGIKRGSWSWDRDVAGNTEGWAHLHMTPDGWARLGELMLRKGNWRGRQLLSRRYLKQVKQPLSQNPAYGLGFWLNRGRRWVVPAVYGPDSGEGPLVPAGPRDMFGLVGMGEQRIWVVPSRDMVIVRLGDRGSLEADTRTTLFTGRAGRLDHELVRRVMLAVTDVHYEDPGSYKESELVLPPLDDGILRDARQVEDAAAGVLGPPYH